MARTTKESTRTTVRVVNLDNKSRKGEYVYVKERGQRGAYYKKTTKELQPYIDYYEQRIVKQDKTVTIKQYKDYYEEKLPKAKITREKIEKYMDVVKKRKPVLANLKKGRNEQTIGVIGTSRGEITLAMQKVVSKLAKDKRKVPLLMKNLSKLKKRMQVKITIEGISTETGQATTLGEIIEIGRKDPRQLIKELQENLLKRNTEVNSKNWDLMVGKLKLHESNKKRRYTNGVIKSAKARIILVR